MRFYRNPEVLWRSTSRGPVLLAPGNPQPDRLSGLSALVWEAIDHPLDIEGIETIATQVIDGPVPDLSAAARELARLGLVLVQR